MRDKYFRAEIVLYRFEAKQAGSLNVTESPIRVVKNNHCTKDQTSSITIQRRLPWTSAPTRTERRATLSSRRRLPMRPARDCARARVHQGLLDAIPNFV